MPAAQSDQPDEGLVFPPGADGRRSTTATGRAVFADGARAVDAELAGRIEHTRDWRSGYAQAAHGLTLAAALAPAQAPAIARAALDAVHQRFRVRSHGAEAPLRTVTAAHEAGFGSVVIEGRLLPIEQVSLPYRGRRISGGELCRQAEQWVAEGIAEPELAAALHALVSHPEWLDLRDLDIAVLGAGAEMGPTRALLRWGATVHAVELPGRAAWQQLIAATRESAGRLRVPIRMDVAGRTPVTVGGLVHPDEDEAIAEVAGANLLTAIPELIAWLREVDGPFTLGTYAYAAGPAHALLAAAADAIAARLLADGDRVGLAYLATPTDAYAVPMGCVEESRRRWDHRGIEATLQWPLRLVGQFAPNYEHTWRSADGTAFGINDAIVTQQGPNYLLAKRIQQWRATSARAAGVPVSMNIAPATRTQSVVRNRALAAAYRGAGHFGIEIFEPATSRALMAALLVHDIRQGQAATGIAVHGGLWRAAYAPRSVLGIAALAGLLTRS